MKKNELKKILKPIVKECIRESLYESGLLSSIISEVVQGVVTGSNATVLEEQAQPRQAAPTPSASNAAAEDEAFRTAKKLQELKSTKDKLLSAIGQGAYNGVNVFEGTEPLRKGGAPSASPTAGGPLSGVAPDDPGVNIDALTDSLGGVWKKLAEGRKK